MLVRSFKLTVVSVLDTKNNINNVLEAVSPESLVQLVSSSADFTPSALPILVEKVDGLCVGSYFVVYALDGQVSFSDYNKTPDASSFALIERTS